MLKLLSSKEKGRKDFWKTLKWVPNEQGFLSFFKFHASFWIGKISHQQHKINTLWFVEHGHHVCMYMHLYKIPHHQNAKS